MNRSTNFQQLKGFLLTKALLALVLAAPGVAAANTGSASLDDIKDTNYPIPAGAYLAQRWLELCVCSEYG